MKTEEDSFFEHPRGTEPRADARALGNEWKT